MVLPLTPQIGVCEPVCLRGVTQRDEDVTYSRNEFVVRTLVGRKFTLLLCLASLSINVILEREDLFVLALVGHQSGKNKLTNAVVGGFHATSNAFPAQVHCVTRHKRLQESKICSYTYYPSRSEGVSTVLLACSRQIAVLCCHGHVE